MLINELIPYVDSSFRTIADQQHRAMVGLSMGGMETKTITLNNPEVFSHYGLMCGGVYAPEDLKNHPNLKMVFLSAGSKENPDRIKTVVQVLKDAGLPAVSYVSDNTAHEFQTWHRSLYQMAPLLFQ